MTRPASKVQCFYDQQVKNQVLNKSCIRTNSNGFLLKQSQRQLKLPQKFSQLRGRLRGRRLQRHLREGRIKELPRSQRIGIVGLCTAIAGKQPRGFRHGVSILVRIPRHQKPITMRTLGETQEVLR